MDFENINCPQFVDFTSIDAFNINDGADRSFDKRIVGELIDLGSFKHKNDQNQNVFKDLSNKFNECLNLNNQAQINKIKDNTINIETKAKIVSKDENKLNKNLSQNKSNNNIIKKKLAQIGAVILPKSNQTNKENNQLSLKKRDLSLPKKPVNEIVKIDKKPPIIRQRTPSQNEAVQIDLKPKIERQSRQRVLSENSKPVKIPYDRKTPSSERVKVLPLYQGLKFVPKNQNSYNILKNSNEKLSNNDKIRPASLNRAFERSSINSSVNKIKSIDNLNNSGFNKSCQKKNTSGFLHTELRALRRVEYENLQKEKEKRALMMKQEFETERLRKLREELRKLRSNSIVRSQAIKHYKPIEVKPSDKPLTIPKSPSLSRSICNHTFQTNKFKN